MTNSTIFFFAAFAVGQSPTDSTLRIDAGTVVNRISPYMYGSCIEDVNHEIYGGLYSQMIFGESFEEPPAGFGLPAWSTYGGAWTLHKGYVSAAADLGAKAVLAAPEITNGVVSCELRFHDDKGQNAGLILRVQNPRLGADDWTGYEVSLSPKMQHLHLGRHRNDYQKLKIVPAVVVPGRWHRLRAETVGAALRIFVDDSKTPAIDYTDQSAPILAGRVGLRTWGSAVDFRNLVVERSEGIVVESFEPRAGGEAGGTVSGAWDPIHSGDAKSRNVWDAERPFNSAHSQRLERKCGLGVVGVANRGLNRWGLAFREGREYAGRLYVRRQGFAGKLTVALQSSDGGRTYASQTIETAGDDWRRCDFSLRSAATDANSRFAIWIDGPGKVWVDQVFLSGVGDELFHGLPIRADLAKGLQREGLKLLRYGGSMVNAVEYRWKRMIGDRDRRPQYRGWWYPNSTNGFGIEEFVQFCRAAGIEPVVSINVEETPADAADLVEYLNGPATSLWGRRRAENGRPEPYRVRYIQLGNEETTDAHYLERFKLLHAAMQPRDPGVQYIIATWWEPKNPISRRIVQELDGKAALWDVHVGGDNPREGAAVDQTFVLMRRLFKEWAPKTTLKACVLEENGGRHNLARALGHAGILNATQRHGDFVLIDSPANCLQPWRQNDNDWDQGQLFFTNSKVWGMPPYYAQQMASEAHLPCRIAGEVVSPGKDLDLTATRDEAETTIVLKVVNAGAVAHRADVQLTGFAPIAPKAEIVSLAGALDDFNPPDAPERIRPKRSEFHPGADRFTFEFPPHSYTILRLKRQ